MTSADDLRSAQLAAVVATLAEKPGLTAYVLGMHVPVPQPGPAEQARTGLLATSAPLPLMLDLLRELQSAGRVQNIPGRAGGRWYLTVTAGCSDCGDTPTVAGIGERRYCHVDVGRHMAAGEPVDYDQDPADGEAPRTETDCRGSGTSDFPARRTGPTACAAAAAAATRTGAAGVADRLHRGTLKTAVAALEEAGWNAPARHARPSPTQSHRRPQQRRKRRRG